MKLYGYVHLFKFDKNFKGINPSISTCYANLQ